MNELDNIVFLYNQYKGINFDQLNLVGSELYHQWYDASKKIFAKYFNPTSNQFFYNFCNVDNSGNGYSLYNNFNSIRSDFEVLIDKIKNGITDNSMEDNANKLNVFIVHGHDDTMRLEVCEFIRDKLNLGVVVLGSLPNKGKTIIEKFTEYSRMASIAVILLSPDDEVVGCAEKRTRQNVLFEWGWFMHALGRDKVISIAKRRTELEMPSDLVGLIHINYEDNWMENLRSEVTGILNL